MTASLRGRHAAPPRPRRLPEPALRLGGAVLVALLLPLLLSALLLTGGGSAAAAEAGSGFSPDGRPESFVGALRFDDEHAYCIELSKPSPIGAPTRRLTDDAERPSPLAAMAPLDRARVNWAIATAGGSADARDTAAVAMYVWSLADPERYAARGDAHFLQLMPAEEREEVAERLAALRAGAQSVRVLEVGSAVGAAFLMRDSTSARLRIDRLPTGTIAEVQLRGGTADGSVVLRLDETEAQVVDIVPDEGAARIEAEIVLLAAARHWSPEPRVLVTDGRQLLVQAHTPKLPTTRVEVEVPAPGTVSGPRNQPNPGPATAPAPEPTTGPWPEGPVDSGSAGPLDDPLTVPTPDRDAETAAEPVTETEPGPAPEPEPTTVPEPEPAAVPEPESATESGPAPAPAPDPGSAPEPGQEPGPESESEHEGEGDAEAESRPEDPSDVEAESGDLAEQPSEPGAGPPTAPEPTRSPAAAPAPAPTPSPAPQLATTGLGIDPAALLVPIGLAVALIGGGGWVLARGHRRDTADSSW